MVDEAKSWLIQNWTYVGDEKRNEKTFFKLVEILCEKASIS